MLNLQAIVIITIIITQRWLKKKTKLGLVDTECLLYAKNCVKSFNNVSYYHHGHYHHHFTIIVTCEKLSGQITTIITMHNDYNLIFRKLINPYFLKKMNTKIDLLI